jgi:hypothetical protein
MLIVATLAKDCATAVASAGMASGVQRNRFSAPRICSRSFIGTAWTAAKPCSRATAANRGHCCGVAVKSAQATPWPLW